MFPRRLAVLPSSLSLPLTLSRRPASSYLSSPPPPIHQQQQCKSSSLSGRGRVKPSKGISVGTRLSAAKLSRHIEKKDQSTSLQGSGRGRTKKRQPSAYDSSLETLSLDTPIETNPLHSALHIACTPSHMPLPIPLGPEQYIRPRTSPLNPVPTPGQWLDQTLGPFDPEIRNQSGLAESIAQPWIPESGRNNLTDHLHVMWNLARPGRYHHLLDQKHQFDPDHSIISTDLSRAVGEASARNRIEASTQWQSILESLGDKPTKEKNAQKQTVMQDLVLSKEEKSEVDLAVDGVTSLLSKLSSGRKRMNSGKSVAVVGSDGGEEWVRLDSTRRKRKTKMNKHKFKKRRKAQRALRKKLAK